MAFLEAIDLHKRLGGVPVLKGVDLSAERGEAVCVIGSSGSGKTTLMRCLNFLEIPDGGSISVDGRRLFSAENKYKDAELRRNRLNFGLVFQSFNLFPQYTALQNVALALRLQTRQRYKAEKRPKSELKRALEMDDARAAKLLADVGLADRLGSYPCTLSGGQCQRVAIARALALEPAVLCFDEPTSALDPELTGEILRVIRSLKSDSRAMVIVTHEMEFARDVSDRVLFMSDGTIAEQGTPEEIFGSPKSEKLRAFLNASERDRPKKD